MLRARSEKMSYVTMYRHLKVNTHLLIFVILTAPFYLQCELLQSQPQTGEEPCRTMYSRGRQPSAPHSPLSDIREAHSIQGGVTPKTCRNKNT
ncbi:hypothetical protein GDO78_002562 [Eleutherodactylus coqui]|uniref:Uncharacterized protein n=1 Tax=Eleutherodactylus coqui TaxID=57060 RepID=A0A8J6EWZ6_ELECQ|nr:hypothetical protein GDO78_002562 [Eleutherodactylus coqui]